MVFEWQWFSNTSTAGVILVTHGGFPTDAQLIVRDFLASGLTREQILEVIVGFVDTQVAFKRGFTGFKESGLNFVTSNYFFFHFQTSNVDLNFFNSLAYLLFSMCLSARFRKSIKVFFRECLFKGLKLLKLFEFWILTIGTFSKGWSVKCQNYTIRFVKKNLRVFLLGKKIISHFINLLLQNADAYKILRKLFCILTVNHLKLKWF